jgi:hypothetical protein
MQITLTDLEIKEYYSKIIKWNEQFNSYLGKNWKRMSEETFTNCKENVLDRNKIPSSVQDWQYKFPKDRLGQFLDNFDLHLAQRIYSICREEFEKEFPIPAII